MAPIFTGRAFGFGRSADGGVQGSGIIASGGTILQPGDGYKYHVWNVDTPSPQNSFVVSSTGTGGLMNFMLIAGGGAGGGPHPSGSYAGTGGGGAGGLVLGVDVPFSATTYPVSIGAGAVGSPGDRQPVGGDSTFFGLRAKGGGGGGYAPNPAGVTGGSGGGGMTTWNPPAQGAPTNQSPSNPIPAPLSGKVTNYGNPGFRGISDPSNVSPGGGGGGAGAGGPVSTYQSAGGNGVPVPWCPAPLIYPTVPGPWQPLFLQNTGPTGDYWAGGGGAGNYPAGPSAAGGFGGGGGTANPGPGEGVFGTGGGGGGYQKNGGSGILVVRYLE